MVIDLDYEGSEFPVSKKDYSKIQNDLTYPVYASNKKFETHMDLLLIIDENKSHHVYIKDLNRFIKQKTLLQILFTMFW